MEKGLTEQSKQLRRHLLNHNAPDVMKWMQESGMEDPVGMIVEMTDDIGKQLTYAALEKQGYRGTRFRNSSRPTARTPSRPSNASSASRQQRRSSPSPPQPLSKTSPPHANGVSTGLSSLVAEETAMRRFRCRVGLFKVAYIPLGGLHVYVEGSRISQMLYRKVLNFQHCINDTTSMAQLPIFATAHEAGTIRSGQPHGLLKLQDR